MLVCSFNTWATTFRKLPLEQMIDESSSAAEVRLVSKKTMMNTMGMIMTEHSFQILESYNLEKNDYDGEILKLTLTGGTINGVTSYIDGAPEFSPGERSFLLLKKLEGRMYLSNFTLGKYRVIEEDGKIFYVSSVFPNDPEMGKVNKDRMIELIKEKFKISYSPSKPKAVVPSYAEQMPAVKESFKRTPAQMNASEQTTDKFPYNLLFITIGTFLFAGVIGYRVLTNRGGR